MTMLLKILSYPTDFRNIIFILCFLKLKNTMDEVNININDKIYNIYIVRVDNEPYYYYGKTTHKTTNDKLKMERYNFKKYSKTKGWGKILSFDNGFNITIEFIETNIIGKNQSKIREGYYINQCIDDGYCCNKYKIDTNYLEDKYDIKEYRKNHYQNNIDKIKERSKQYNKNNIDKIKEMSKKPKWCWLCDKYITTGNFTTHCKSITHNFNDNYLNYPD